MTRTRLITSLLAAALFVAPAMAQERKLKWTAGPMTLCGDEAFVATMFNPREFTIEKSTTWTEAETGELISELTTSVPPQQGSSVVATQTSASVVGTLPEPATHESDAGKCTTVIMASDITYKKGDGSKAQGSAYFDGRFLSVDDLKQEQSYFRSVHSGFVAFPAAGSATSAPFVLRPGVEPIIRMVNVGDAAAGVTIELLDARTGLVVDAATHLVSAAGRLQHTGYVTEFLFVGNTFPESPTPFVLRVSVDQPTAMRAGAVVELAISIEAPSEPGYKPAEFRPLRFNGPFERDDN